jgi:hypothetical protein
MIELKHSTSAPASIEIHEVKKDRTIEDVPPRDIEAASAPPPNYKEEFTRNETDTFNPKISVAKSSSFLNEFTEKPSTPKNESSNNIDLLKAPGSEVRAL